MTLLFVMTIIPTLEAKAFEFPIECLNKIITLAYGHR